VSPSNKKEKRVGRSVSTGATKGAKKNARRKTMYQAHVQENKLHRGQKQTTGGKKIEIPGGNLDSNADPQFERKKR